MDHVRERIEKEKADKEARKYKHFFILWNIFLLFDDLKRSTVSTVFFFEIWNRAASGKHAEFVEEESLSSDDDITTALKNQVYRYQTEDPTP